MKIKIKKSVKIVKEHNKKISIFVVILVAFVVIWFWQDIINTLTVLLEGLKKNWKTILLGLISYKVIMVNLAKRYAINKGMDRFKKSLIYSELDELLHIGMKIFISDIGKKIKKAEKIAYIGWLIRFIVRVITWIIIMPLAIWGFLKSGLFKIVFTKVLSAQFWTAILVWLSNIPGFFTFLGVWFWIWLETKIPWIPRFYNWISLKIRVYLDPYWNRIEPKLNYISDYIVNLEVKLLTPIGDKIDSFELYLISRLKEYIYFKKGEKKYDKYMNLVKKHNQLQYDTKTKKEKERRIKNFSMLRKRATALKKIAYKK